jgi:hypothetical protein
MNCRLQRLVLWGSLLCPLPALAQEACDSFVDTAVDAMVYTPARWPAAENGHLFAGPVGSALGGDQDVTDKVATGFAPRRSDESGTVTAVVDVIEGWAEAQTFLFGYGSAGVDVVLEVGDGDGAILCSHTEELYHAYYFDAGNAVPGPRTLSCELPGWAAGTRDWVTVSVTLVAWYTVGGAAAARSSGHVQLISIGWEGCSGSCAGTCGMQSASGTCWCDSQCAGLGDCCADYAPLCQPDSCWEQCGWEWASSPSGQCFCDSLCTDLGDCCSDYAASCG